MKKIYFLASALVLAGAANAQNFVPVQKAAVVNTPSFNENRPNAGQDRAPGDVISTYSDDFSTPSNWVVANTSSPAMNFAINTTGPGSAPALINSTSGGNFAWYDCDPQGNGSTVDATLTYATTFNLGSNPTVMVSFEQFYMDYYEDTYVEVSINGMAGPWTQYEVNGGYLPNSYSDDNPVNQLVNISSLAGGETNVAIRFHYVGGWGWSWQIDDFALIEAWENDLTIFDTYMTSGTERNDYYMIPTNQITEITFGSFISSNGVVSQPSVYMDVNVDGGAEYSEVSGQSVTLNENEVDTFSIETPNGWTPSGNGVYALEMEAVTDTYTDDLLYDNVEALEPITVGGNIYARDNGVVSGSFSGFTSTQGEPLEIGNTFEFFANQQFGRVQVGITTSTNSDGQLAFASVYKWNGQDNFDYVTQSDDYTIQTSDLGTIITFDLQDNVDAVAGDVFLVCAGHYGGDPTVAFAEAQPVLENTVLAMSSQGLIGSADPSAVIVRIMFEPTSIGITENATPATGISAYPNPANTQVTVVYNLNEASDVNLTITDISGKVVYVENYGNQSKGSYNVELNTEDFNNGVYFYTLTVNGTSTTKKFVVAHK